MSLTEGLAAAAALGASSTQPSGAARNSRRAAGRKTSGRRRRAVPLARANVDARPAFPRSRRRHMQQCGTGRTRGWSPGARESRWSARAMAMSIDQAADDALLLRLPRPPAPLALVVALDARAAAARRRRRTARQVPDRRRGEDERLVAVGRRERERGQDRRDQRPVVRDLPQLDLLDRAWTRGERAGEGSDSSAGQYQGSEGAQRATRHVARTPPPPRRGARVGPPRRQSDSARPRDAPETCSTLAMTRSLLTGPRNVSAACTMR